MWHLLKVNIKSEALNAFFYSKFRIKQLLSFDSVKKKKTGFTVCKNTYYVWFICCSWLLFLQSDWRQW
jgi:hypothetical protein